ncbi:peptidoglycan-binding protein [Aerosakkonemataceae cyanobacterium BLCC-F50]|uniref:Peptidoglycan-binding protein n=1 Tax=Floridaenema flaviceps BLCC-F50 TaxID=3153642 RepID=A0ABV4XVI9_9CYAN
MNLNQKITDTACDAAFTGKEIHPWDSGPAVAELQGLLRAHGYTIRIIDGDFGSLTEAAVRSFQKKHGLRINGVVGPQTWAALKSSVKPGARVLRQGYSGSDVYELQGLLQVNGYEINRTGIFDQKTKLTIKDFQQKHKLKDNGIVNSITWTLLRGGYPDATPSKEPFWLSNFLKWR